MSKLRVLLVGSGAAELDGISGLLEKGGHSALPLETMGDASEALGLQRFDAVLVEESTPADQFAAFASELRQTEKDRRGDGRTALILYSGSVREAKLAAVNGDSPHADALIPNEFDPAIIAKIVEQVRTQLTQSTAASVTDVTEGLTVFDQEGFSELLSHSQELLDEIIGLFLDECGSQLREMENCLQTRDFVSLAKVAHTLKGSLGTLHAHRARARAQFLEIAATERMQEQSRSNLELLKGELNELLPLVIRMRSEL